MENNWLVKWAKLNKRNIQNITEYLKVLKYKYSESTSEYYNALYEFIYAYQEGEKRGSCKLAFCSFF